MKDHQRESSAGTRRQVMHVYARWLCPTLCDPMDYNPTGSSIHGIVQARILEWILCPHPGDLPNPGTEFTFPVSPVAHALQADSLPTEPPGKPMIQSHK